MLKKITKKKIFIKINLIECNYRKKTLNFYRGPTAKFKLQFDRNFVESQAKERFLK